MRREQPVSIHTNYDKEERERMEFLVYLIFGYIFAFSVLIVSAWLCF